MSDVVFDPSNLIYSTIPVPKTDIVVNVYEDGTITKHQPNQHIMTITPDNEISVGLSNKRVKISANGEVWKIISNLNSGTIIKITPDDDILKLNYIENQLNDHIIIKSDNAIRKGKRDFENNIFDGIMISSDDIIKMGIRDFLNNIFNGLIIYPNKTVFDGKINCLGQDINLDNSNLNKKRRRNSL